MNINPHTLGKALKRWRPEWAPLAQDREALGAALNRVLHEPLKPEEIEARSFFLLEKEDPLKDFSEPERTLVKRLLHATVDFDLAHEMVFHPQAVSKALQNLKAGKDLLVDVEMVRAGINKRLLSSLGGHIHCHIADEDIFQLSAETGRPRAELAVEKGLKKDIGLIVVGNAPTALIRAIELLKQEPYAQDVVIIGVPVGMVKAFEAKLYLALQDIPFITNLGPKGGSTVAVALVNALLGLCS